ncbi:glycosyltransferase [Microbulbifer harenosus]|uniref:Glycosyltransferase family 4 protein n=1 Tax=Microbulbifer harenosus TaxID=2576840 RepID=A0ABY2UFQ6_9GAMM|nr:glycosyltransferase [Microbulbifer harenosus]TLM76342.1 glycosyltransferase family 4 protein [Microbulbifer harenosus]
MNIVMLTNTYLPHVGGVARSVDAFSREYRRQGHQVLVVAPEFAEKIDNEKDVVRIPAIQNFNGSDFSVALPLSGELTERLDFFEPDLVHSHHPFLLGMTALRIARSRELPLIFTHHTLYERYTHYVPADSETLKRFVIELATRYGNLASMVFAPSESVADLLRERGVKRPIAVVPTGVQLENYRHGDGASARQQYNIPQSAFVIGHLGRLAEEKNLDFLTDVVIELMHRNDDIHFLVVGAGPMQQRIRSLFDTQSLSSRLHLTGTLQGDAQRDAYSAMNVFGFSSTSETQGMVLTEAMAAGVPVVALDASGCREVVEDRINGRLVLKHSTREMIAALQWVHDLAPEEYQRLCQAALQTAERFSMENCAASALRHYQSLVHQHWPLDDSLYAQWMRLRNTIGAQWEILEGVTGAATAALDPDHALKK